MAAQFAGDLFNGNIASRTFRRVARPEHFPFASRFKIPMKLFVEQGATNACAGGGIVRSQRRCLHYESAFCVFGHHRILLGRC